MSSRVGEHGEPGVLQERSDVEYPVAHPKRQKIDFIGNIKYRLGMSIEVPKKEVKEAAELDKEYNEKLRELTDQAARLMMFMGHELGMENDQKIREIILEKVKESVESTSTFS
ncbi:MAG: hypothetical protein AAB495_01040 [Patescibacteria group bacterium]